MGFLEAIMIELGKYFIYKIKIYDKIFSKCIMFSLFSFQRGCGDFVFNSFFHRTMIGHKVYTALLMPYDMVLFDFISVDRACLFIADISPAGDFMGDVALGSI